MPSSDPDLRPPSPPSARIAVVLILLVGIATTIWAFYETRVHNSQRAEDEFARRAAVLHSLTEGIIDSYVDALFDLHLVFTLKGELDQAQFTRIARTLLQHNPGITALEWVPAVSASQRAALERAWPPRPGQAFAGFTELDATGHLVPASERAEYYPITFIEPLAGNERALGYDLQSGPTRTDLERARRSRQMALSGQVHLVQEPQDKTGVVILMTPSAVPRDRAGPGRYGADRAWSGGRRGPPPEPVPDAARCAGARGAPGSRASPRTAPARGLPYPGAPRHPGQ